MAAKTTTMTPARIYDITGSMTVQPQGW